MRDYKIVCVDDEELILEIYKSSLEDVDHEVVTFSNPEKALKYIIENKLNCQFFRIKEDNFNFDKFINKMRRI